MPFAKDVAQDYWPESRRDAGAAADRALGAAAAAVRQRDHEPEEEESSSSEELLYHTLAPYALPQMTGWTATRCIEDGEKPITSKELFHVQEEGNLPRIYDMHLSWMAECGDIPAHKIAVEDECPIKYGKGQHAKRGRSDAGTKCLAEGQKKFSQRCSWSQSTTA